MYLCLAQLRGISLRVLPNQSVVSLICAFYFSMSRPTFIHSTVVYHDHSKEFHIDANGRDLASIIRTCQSEDITEVQAEENEPKTDSMIFTRKAKQESKVNEILQALQKSVVGRKDKTRAFVQELHVWQKDEYIDAHFNARVMYDELGNMLPLPFGYEVFKKHYNNTRF